MCLLCHLDVRESPDGRPQLLVCACRPSDPSNEKYRAVIVRACNTPGSAGLAIWGETVGRICGNEHRSSSAAVILISNNHSLWGMLSSRIGTMFGRYKITGLVGEGGMGTVYQAYDTEDRTVALKVLAEQYSNDDRFLERFRRESHAAAVLQDPHVIPIHDWGEIDGNLFIDMRLVDGTTLHDLLKKARSNLSVLSISSAKSPLHSTLPTLRV